MWGCALREHIFGIRALIISIELLRSIAALLVVFLHASNGYFGACGVDIFFVISGFIMSLVIDRGEIGFHFIKNRLIRIVPSYWFLTLILFGAAQFIPFAVKSSVSASDLYSSLFFMPFLKSSGAIQPVLNVGWSLNYEMLFYALIFVSSLFVREKAIYLACVLLLIVCVASRYIPSYVISNFYGDTILVEFVYGCLIFRFKDANYLKKTPFWARCFIVVFIFIGLYVLEVRYGMILRPYTSGALAAALLIAILTFDDWLQRCPMLVKELVSLGGRISYSLYLTHPFTIGIIFFVFNRCCWFDPMGSSLLMIFLVLTSVVVSCVFYGVFDRPTYKFLKNAFQSK